MIATLNNSTVGKVRNCCVLLFLLMSLQYIAQGGFKKKYYPTGSLSSVCANVIEAPDGSLIGLGITIDTISSQQVKRLTLIGTNQQGTLLWKKSYGNYAWQYYSNIEQGFVDSTGYYQAVVIDDLGLRTAGALIKFNFQGDTIWQKVYREPSVFEDLVPTSIARTLDGGFIMTGFFQNWASNATDKLLLIKTDSDGKELWRKKILGTNLNWQNIIWGYGIAEDSITKRILISGFQYLGTATAYSSYGGIFCTDSLGNTLWQKAFMNKGSPQLERVVALNNGHFMAVGSNCTQYDSDGAGKRWQGAVIKFDVDGNLLWNKVYDSPGYSTGLRQIIGVSPDKLVIAGIVDSSYTHNWNGSPVIEILVIDHKGDLLRSKLVGSSKEQVFGTGEMPRSLFHCKDKGFVLATQLPTAPNPQPYSILKIDSTFCDTLEAYCRAVELGIHEVQSTAAGFRVFPNPTGAQVTVELNPGAVHTLAVLITDMSGRPVKHIDLEIADTFQVPLNDLEAGVYGLQVLADGRSRGWQKVVVQH